MDAVPPDFCCVFPAYLIFCGSRRTLNGASARLSQSITETHRSPFLARFVPPKFSVVISDLGNFDVAIGTVKWFNPTKGYGFIQPDTDDKDFFVHISAVQKAGLSTLNEGAKVSYEVVANRGKESAENLRVG
jgi:CspA family cold shock protein